MNPKLLIVLSALAVVLGGLALALVARDSRTTEAAELGLLFPDLAERLNDAVEVEVQSPEDSYTLRLAGERWVLVDKGGYPVKIEDIRRTLWALCTLEKRERMTDDPARYERLGVQDPDASGAASKRLVLRDATGAELAALIVGEARGSGRGVASFYARVPSERRSWLVEGELPLPADASAWLDRQPIKLERKEVRAVETRHPDGELVRISRPSREQDTFDVHDVPEGRELRFATVASGMGTALEYLSFLDVMPADDFQVADEAPVETTVWTFDGLRVDARVWTQADDEHWVAFEVAHEPQAPAAADEVGPPAAEGDVEPEDPARAEATRERVERLRERLSGWVYKIAPYNHGNLAKRMEDLTQPIAPPGTSADPEWDVDMDFGDFDFGEPLDADAEDPAPERHDPEEPARGDPAPDQPPSESDEAGEEPDDGEEGEGEDDGLSEADDEDGR